MKIQLFRNSLFFLTIFILLFACKKKETTPPPPIVDSDISAASDNAFVETCYNDIDKIANEAYLGSLSYYKTLSNCATIKRDTANHADLDTIIIDFGGTNCICADGRARQGKIIVAYTGKYTDSVSVDTITFNNYYVNNNRIDGIKVVNNRGYNGSPYLSWDITVNGIVQLANNGGTITWTSVRNRQMVAGDSTLTLTDDVYYITGTSTGTSTNGVSYAVNIINPLVDSTLSLACSKYFTKGTLNFIPTGKLTRTVDFGNGKCDSLATVSIAGISYPLTLK